MSQLAGMLSRKEGSAPPEGDDEARLLVSLRAGDRAAAEELAERSYRTIFASLFRLCGGDADLAADLTQESYQRAWAALPQFRGSSRFSTWLYRIAYTTFLNHVRRPARLVPLDDKVATSTRSSEEGADARISRDEEAARLRQAVLKLPDELRFTVTAHFWAGLPVREIAELESVTSAAIRKRLNKAFFILEASLEDTPS